MPENSPPGVPKPKITTSIENLDPSDSLLRLTVPKIIEEHVRRYELVADRFAGRKNDMLVILDSASGRGYGSAILAKNFPNAKIVAGMELGRAYTKKAHEKYATGDTSPAFAQADVTSLPVASGSVDIATGFEITEHIEKNLQEQYVRELFRVLKPGGTAFVSIPHRYSFELNRKGETVRSGLFSNPHHRYEPTRDEMADLFTKAGFSLSEELGQITVSPKQAELMRKANKVVPVWPIFAWHPGRDVSVKPVPEGQVALTHIFVVTKP